MTIESETLKKLSLYNNNTYTYNIDTDPSTCDKDVIRSNMKIIHTHIVHTHIENAEPNKVLNMIPPKISASEARLPRGMRRTLAQLRTDKSPFLRHYLHKINPEAHTSPMCPFCNGCTHDTRHLFTCTQLHTKLTPLDLWRNPVEVASLLEEWGALIGRSWDPGGGAR